MYFDTILIRSLAKAEITRDQMRIFTTELLRELGSDDGILEEIRLFCWHNEINRY
jgi:hypothetical protein